MGAIKKILVTRLSALGDVAMTIPVMKQVLDDNPEAAIIFVTNKNWEPLCAGISRLTFFPADVKGEHKGIIGLYRLFRAVTRTHRICSVADLHNVLRSKILRTFFKISGTPVAFLDKGRSAKKALTRSVNKVLEPLPGTIERYAIVFRKLGFRCNMGTAPVFAPQILNETIKMVTGAKEGKKWIGIAPFAAYREKMYPLSKMETVLESLVQQPENQVFLLGGKQELSVLSTLTAKNPQVILIAGHFSLWEEMAIISQLDMMISMDSANMHLASLFGVPVVSIWGATHPFAGFMGYGQLPENVVQINGLACRPCSVFGNKPCVRRDHACMEWIDPADILAKIKKVNRC